MGGGREDGWKWGIAVHEVISLPLYISSLYIFTFFELWKMH